MLSDVVLQNLLWSRSVHCCQCASIESAAFSHHIRHIQHKKMGNSGSVCHVTNYGKRTIRVFLTKQPLAIDDVLTSESKGDDRSCVGKTFSFKSDVGCVRILPSQGKEVHCEPQEFMNVFVEDEEHEDVCCKHVMHNMVMKAPFAVLLYDA